MTLQCESLCVVSVGADLEVTVKYPKTCPPRLMTFAGMVLPSHSMIANPLPRNFLFLLSRHRILEHPSHGRFVHGALVKLRLELLSCGQHHVGVRLVIGVMEI